jgi:glycosyltransferase involved in cell wall biosynthesis
MKVSIITVCYNSEKTIYDSLLSIKNQTYKNIEHIIIDANSQDSTLSIVSKFEHVNFVISEKDNGIYDAMNKGISIATGDIIGILNSDDILINNNIISDITNAFNNNVNIDMIYGNLYYVENYNLNKILRKWVSKPYFENYFENGNVPPHPTLYIKKNVYNNSIFFNLKYTLAADYEFMLRVFKVYKYNSLYIDKYFVKMRNGGATSKNWKNRYIQNKEIIAAWNDNNLKLPSFFIIKRIFIKLLQYF